MPQWFPMGTKSIGLTLEICIKAENCPSNEREARIQCILNLYQVYFQCIFSIYLIEIQCIFDVHSMYVQCIFKVTKYDLADARCTRCRSLPAMQLV